MATPQPGFSTGTATNLALPYSEYQYHTRASAAQELDSATSSKALAVEPTMLLKNLTRASVEAAGSRYGSIQQKSDTSRALSRSQRAGRPCAFRNALGRIPWNKELFPDPVTGLRLALRHVLELLPNSSRPISAPLKNSIEFYTTLYADRPQLGTISRGQLKVARTGEARCSRVDEAGEVGSGSQTAA